MVIEKKTLRQIASKDIQYILDEPKTEYVLRVARAGEEVIFFTDEQMKMRKFIYRNSRYKSNIVIAIPEIRVPINSIEISLLYWQGELAWWLATFLPAQQFVYHYN